MTLSDKQYERIARWIDGEAIDLSDAERAAAADLRADMQRVAPHLSAEAPPKAIQAAQNRMRAELARPKHRWVRVASAAGAVAAAVVLAIGAWMYLADQPAGPTDGYTPDDSTDIAAIDGRVATTGPALAASTVRNEVQWTVESGVIDLRLDAVEAELQQADVAAGDPAEWFNQLGA